MNQRTDEVSPIYEDTALENYSASQIRARAMATVLTWVADGDHTYDALNVLVTHDADMNGNGVIDDDDEQMFYNELIGEISDVMGMMGADPDTVADFLNNEDDDAGEKIGAYLSDVMDEEENEDSELVARYATKLPVMESAKIVPWEKYEWGNPDFNPVMESVFKKMISFAKKAGGGIKKLIKRKRVSGRAHLSQAQKKAVKMMQKMAHKGSAMKKRLKTMAFRRKAGY